MRRGASNYNCLVQAPHLELLRALQLSQACYSPRRRHQRALFISDVWKSELVVTSTTSSAHLDATACIRPPARFHTHAKADFGRVQGINRARSYTRTVLHP